MRKKTFTATNFDLPLSVGENYVNSKYVCSAINVKVYSRGNAFLSIIIQSVETKKKASYTLAYSCIQSHTFAYIQEYMKRSSLSQSLSVDESHWNQRVMYR